VGESAHALYRRVALTVTQVGHKARWENTRQLRYRLRYTVSTCGPRGPPGSGAPPVCLNDSCSFFMFRGAWVAPDSNRKRWSERERKRERERERDSGAEGRKRKNKLCSKRPVRCVGKNGLDWQSKQTRDFREGTTVQYTTSPGYHSNSKGPSDMQTASTKMHYANGTESSQQPDAFLALAHRPPPLKIGPIPPPFRDMHHQSRFSAEREAHSCANLRE